MFPTCRLTCSVICLSRSSNSDADETFAAITAAEATVVGTAITANFTVSFSAC